MNLDEKKAVRLIIKLNQRRMNETNEKPSNSVHFQNQSVNPSNPAIYEASERSPLVTFRKTSNEDIAAEFSIRSGKELRKSLGFKHAFACIVSILFGSGIFISPSLVARQTSNMGMALVVWVIAGIPSLFGALCFCELACMYKKTGSYYLFILEAYGDVVGFMVIWIEAIIIVPSGFAIVAVAIGEHIIDPLPDLENYSKIWLVKFVGIMTVALAAAINCVSAAFVGKSQILFSAIQSLSALFLVVLGIIQVASGHVENYPVMFTNSTEAFDIGRFGLALYNGLWAYDGWGGTASIAEELHNLERDLWLSLVTGIPFVIICYLFINLALMSALTKNEIARSDTVATVFVAKVLGTKASYIIPAAVALSCFGCMIGAMFMNGRDLLSAAREGHVPSVLCYIHKSRRTPIPALLCILIFTTIWILPVGNGLETLVTYFSIAVWLKYGLAIISVILMRRRRPDLERPFKVWIANPIFTGLFSLFLIIIPFVKRPVASTVSLFLFLTALPIYYIFIKKHDCLPSFLLKATDNFNHFLSHRCNLVPCVFKDNATDDKTVSQVINNSDDTKL